jgi:hypothetical protein
LDILRSSAAQSALQSNSAHSEAAAAALAAGSLSSESASKATTTNLNNGRPQSADLFEFPESVRSNMKIIFEQFDKDNDGKISKHELSYVMCNLFPDEQITEEDIQHMLHEADLDNNGAVDFEGKIHS